jgi:predicted Zn-dependent protease
LLGAIGAPSAAVAAGSDDTSGTDRTRSEYEQAVELVEAADYEEALEVLVTLNRNEPGNADVLNMLGFAHRKLGRVETAFDYYRDALAIEPRHLGANEYLGELYLETGELEKAEERLGELVAACPSGCEERDELSEAIAAYRKAHGL